MCSATVSVEDFPGDVVDQPSLLRNAVPQPERCHIYPRPGRVPGDQIAVLSVVNGHQNAVATDVAHPEPKNLTVVHDPSVGGDSTIHTPANPSE